MKLSLRSQSMPEELSARLCGMCSDDLPDGGW